MKEENSQQVIKSKQQSSLLEPSLLLPKVLAEQIQRYPENQRRRVNKTVFKNDYFQLTYNVNGDTLAIASRGDLVYSAIPYDTARKYIQRAAVQYVLHPQAVREYIKEHKSDLEKYLMLSIFQITKKQVAETSSEVQAAYHEIFTQPFFEIQIAGRLLQHDETGPLSANLAGKFLFSENQKTGISEYTAEYLKFVVELTSTLPLTTDGKVILLIDPSTMPQVATTGLHKSLSYASDLSQVPALFDLSMSEYEEPLQILAQMPNHKPLLRSTYGAELQAVRKNYVAHSVHPEELMSYFSETKQVVNQNQINVVSDIHASQETLPFTNEQFNILAGDIMEKPLLVKRMPGLLVLGNHELTAVLPKSSDFTAEEQAIWQPYAKTAWFKKLLNEPDEAWPLLPLGNHPFYETVKKEVSKSFPTMRVLNNESFVYGGIRYLCLTIPVVLLQKKAALQSFIFQTLRKLLADDQEIPTVIVSHAPLFNELSLLSPSSRAYQKDYNCENTKLAALFETFNIVGVIHGHHHIPASKGRYKLTTFGSKEYFVVCSIYSKLNTGFELRDLL